MAETEAARLHASPPAHPWLEWAARFGYAACGIVYLAIGIGAIAVAFGLANEPTGSHGVVTMFAQLPFGQFVLAGLGVGLAGYAALNLVGAINDPERRGFTLSGLIGRSVDVLTSAIYIALAIAALGRVANPSVTGAGSAVGWATAVLSLSNGQTLLALIGASLIVGGVFLFYRAFRERFGESLDRRMLSPETRRLVAIAARAGTAARGLIFIVCGLLVARAAATSQADIVGDAGDALRAIGATAIGPLLLTITGAGFIAYGIYQLAKARYQRIASAADPIEVGSQVRRDPEALAGQQ